MGYGTFETLRRQNAVLKGTVELNSGIQLAAWYNNCDTVTVRRTAGKMAAARTVFV